MDHLVQASPDQQLQLRVRYELWHKGLCFISICWDYYWASFQSAEKSEESRFDCTCASRRVKSAFSWASLETEIKEGLHNFIGVFQEV